MYLEAIADPTGHHLSFAEKTILGNPESAELQAKGLDLLIAAGKTESALQAASNIAKLHGKHPKSARAIDKFKNYLKSADTTKLKEDM